MDWILYKLKLLSQLEYLERKNLALGRQIDAIREKRLALKPTLEQLRAATNG